MLNCRLNILLNDLTLPKPQLMAISVMLDEAGKSIRKSIIWCDGRTTKQCRDIENIIGHERLIEITANPALEGFTASKIMWIKENEPENYKKCRHILLPKDYIRFKLTGEFATEVSDASGMQLLDIKNRCWSKEICQKLDIDINLLASMHESCDVTGYITKEASLLCGIKEGIPVADMGICGGGEKSDFWRRMLADVYNLDVKTFVSDEGPALGAAILGGCAGGVYSSVEEGCKKAVKNKDVITHNIERHAEYMRFYEIYKNLYSDLKLSFSKLGNC